LIDILREFEKIAIQVVKDNKKHFLQYNEMLRDGQFQSDRKTVISIQAKYYEEKNIDFARLIGLQENDMYLGYIELGGSKHSIDEDLFDTDDGINVIRKILDLLDIEYDCKYCLVQPACKVTDHIGECEGAYEMFNNPFFNGIIKDIIKHS